MRTQNDINAECYDAVKDKMGDPEGFDLHKVRWLLNECAKLEKEACKYREIVAIIEQDPNRRTI